MAGCSIDTAFKNLIVSGANSKKIAILDNFCWCSSDEPDRLYQLKEAAKACYDYAVAYQTPFISGKDSMFNDFKGFDKTGKSVKISIPPTLLISSIGVVDKISHLTKITPDDGDILLVLGNTRNELQDSVYSKIIGYEKSKNPVVNSKDALRTYRNFEKTNKIGIINSAIGIDLGGIGIAVTKMAIASKKGLTIDLKLKNKFSVDQFLFSETQSRILVSIKKNKLANFKKIFKASDYTIIGKCTGSDVIEFKDNKKIMRGKISDFAKATSLKLLKNFKCAFSTFVIIAISGFAIFVSFDISPGLFMPSSKIPKALSFGILDRLSGRPIWLFRFPIVEVVGPSFSRISLNNSFVVVFPTLPVIPIICA